MNTFFLIFVGLPALEIFLMIKIGGEIGAFNTVALIFLTAIVGLFYARVQGIQILKSGIVNMYQNKVPIDEIISGTSIALATLLLIIPGFFTDLIGFLLLIPFTRNILLKIFIKKKIVKNKSKENNTIDGEIVKKDKDDL
tara:strand:+ start:24 stop:443 length:420 start_codon:yes stop_codon:yes gene_type:complete